MPLFRKSLFSWVRGEVQARWAIQYLLRIGKYTTYPNGNKSIRDTLIECTEYWKGDEEDKKIIDKMKNAWAQQKRRMNLREKKSYTFIMSVGVKKQLKELAKLKDMTINDTLEKFIGECLDVEKMVRADIKAEVDRMKGRVLKMLENKSRINDLTLQSRLKEMQAHMKEVDAYIDMELALQCQYLVQMEDAKVFAYNATGLQKIQSYDLLAKKKAIKENLMYFKYLDANK